MARAYTIRRRVFIEEQQVPEEIELDVSAILQGEPAPTPLVLNERQYTVRVRYPDEARASVDAIRNTILISSNGKTATLGSLATLTEQPGQTEIRRENLQRDVAVTGRLEGLNLGAGIVAVKKAVAGLNLPPSIRVEYGGAYQEQQRSFHDLVIVLALNLDALRPDFVRRLDVDEDAGVVGLGRDFDKTPFDGEKIIAVDLRGAEVAGRFAGAMNDAVGDAPGVLRVGVVLHAKGPAGKILLVEQRDGHFAGAWQRVRQIGVLGITGGRCK